MRPDERVESKITKINLGHKKLVGCANSKFMGGIL